jgi:hypothetical protein
VLGQADETQGLVDASLDVGRRQPQVARAK